MAWTAPFSATSGTALTASQWNTTVRDNLNETAPAKATTAARLIVTTGLNSIAERALLNDEITTSESTASTSYVNLSTVGPDVTLVTGVKALVIVSAFFSNSSAGARTWMGYAVTGASSVAAIDTKALMYESSNASDEIQASYVVIEDGLVAGSNTFTAKYRVTTGTGTWANRYINVLGL